MAPQTTPFDDQQVKIGRFFIRHLSKANVALFKATNGRLGRVWHLKNERPTLTGPEICLLTTTGRKTGEERVAPLLFMRDGADVVVVASQGGMPKNPPWYLNLKADPEVKIQFRATADPYVARLADTAEKARLWPRLVEMYSDFETYQERAGDREIPVVICTPAG